MSLFSSRCVVMKFNQTGSMENKIRLPRIFLSWEKRDIMKKVNKNSKINAPQLAKDVTNTSNQTFNAQTSQNVLHEGSNYGRASGKNSFHFRN